MNKIKPYYYLPIEDIHQKSFFRESKIKIKERKRTDSKLQILSELRNQLRCCVHMRDEFIKAENLGAIERSNNVMDSYIKNLDSEIRKLSYKLNNLKRGL